MKILVTGSKGNIGHHLVPHLAECGHTVRMADSIAGFPSEYLQSSIMNPTDLTEYFADFKPDVIVHLAAMVSRVTCEAAMSMCYDVNLMGTVNMIAVARHFGARLVHFSTSEIYGNIDGTMSEDMPLPQPNNRYGHSKWLSEKIVEYEASAGLNAVILRPFMMYHEDETWGDHRSAMIRFCLAAANNQKFEVHKGSERAWFHADDAVRAIEAACHYSGPCQCINIGSGEYIETEELAKKICELFGADFNELASVINLPGRMTLKKRPVLDKMSKILKVTPQVSLDEGLQRIKDHLSQS